MAYDNTNTFILFRNNKKTKDSHPDYSGSMNVDGEEKQISAWIKEGKSGKFMSGRIAEPYVPGEDRTEKKSAPAKIQIDEDSDIPF